MKIPINDISKIVKVKVNIISPEWQRYDELMYANEKN